MSKQSIKQRETHVTTNQGVGNQVEQTLTIDDNALPSPQEIAAYKAIDPRFVEYLLKSSEKEQEHRHEMERDKMKLLKYSEGRNGRMNWWGMFFAAVCVIMFMGVAALALYLNHPWFASFFGISGLVSIVSIFVNNGQSKNNTLVK